MDIQLPVMNGIDATKTIRAIERKQKIGVLPSTCPSPSSSTLSLLSAKEAHPLKSLEAEAAAAVKVMGSQESAENMSAIDLSIAGDHCCVDCVVSRVRPTGSSCSRMQRLSDKTREPRMARKKNHGVGMYAGPD